MMDLNTGKKININQHIHQSIMDIILTPKGETILNRNYGSWCYKMLDQPNSQSGLLASQIITDVNNIESRVKIKEVKTRVKGSGVNLDLTLNNGTIINGDINGIT